MPRKQYTDEKLAAALAEIESGSTYKSVSQKYGISVGTLHNKKNKRHEGVYGSSTALTEAMETLLVNMLNILARFVRLNVFLRLNFLLCLNTIHYVFFRCVFRWRVPLTKMEFRILVKKFLDNLQYVATAFKDNFPGEKWLKGFIHRHKLSKRLADKIRSGRSNVSHDIVTVSFGTSFPFLCIKCE